MRKTRGLPQDDPFLSRLNQAVGDYLRRAKSAGWQINSKLALAKAIGCDPSTLHKWLSGTLTLRRETLEQLCEHIHLERGQQLALLELHGSVVRVVEPASPPLSIPAAEVRALAELLLQAVGTRVARAFRDHDRQAALHAALAHGLATAVQHLTPRSCGSRAGTGVFRCVHPPRGRR